MNYSELVTAIQSYCATTEADFTAQINKFIISAEDKIFAALRGPQYWKTSTALTFTTGSNTFSLPAGTIDVLEVYVVGTTADEYGRHLLRKDHAFLREAYPSREANFFTGMPRFYTVTQASVSGGSPIVLIDVAPRPDKVYTSTVEYYGKTTSDSITNGNTPGASATTTTWISVVYPDVLLYGALVDAYTFQKGEPDVLQTYKDNFEQGLMLIKNMGESRMDTDAFSHVGKQESAV